MRSVCVFCGSRSGNDPEFTAAAAAVAGMLADLSLQTVYGGGSVGVMGALADACLARQAPIIGVIPQSLADVELLHPDVRDMRVVPDMHARKALLHLADRMVEQGVLRDTARSLMTVLDSLEDVRQWLTNLTAGAD